MTTIASVSTMSPISPDSKGRGQQHDDHEFAEPVEHTLPPAARRGFGQPVGAVPASRAPALPTHRVDLQRQLPRARFHHGAGGQQIASHRHGVAAA